MVMLGAFFDLFDGLFARLLKAESQFGLQFDSMADLITSGIVPGVVMYKLFWRLGSVRLISPLQCFKMTLPFHLHPLPLWAF